MTFSKASVSLQMSNLIGVVQSGAMRADSIRPFPAAAGNAGSHKTSFRRERSFYTPKIPRSSIFLKFVPFFFQGPSLDLGGVFIYTYSSYTSGKGRQPGPEAIRASGLFLLPPLFSAFGGILQSGITSAPDWRTSWKLRQTFRNIRPVPPSWPGLNFLSAHARCRGHPRPARRPHA